MKDLIILVADGDMEQLVTTLLKRLPIQEHNIREFSFDIRRHPERDPGICKNSAELLRYFLNSYTYALVMCDYEGCGKDKQKNHLSRVQIERDIEETLSKNGWIDRNCAVVVDPEIENWIWVHHSHMHRAIGWNRKETIREWALTEGWLQSGISKPSRPKEALEAALFEVKTPRSAAIYKKIAETASYKNCIDPAFIKFIEIIRQWFKIELSLY